MEEVLKVENISKVFLKNLKATSQRGIKDTARAILGLAPQKIQYDSGEGFSALKSVSFDLKKGETLALMGKNGAGKSTLLKHIAGLMMPDQGRIRVTKNLEAMIELGAGMHPLYTGKENAAYKCALRGFSKAQTAKLVDEIIDFAELKEFADMPVKNYSSGMKARLGFAATVAMEPDLLLIDEVLSVGDFAFQQKCHHRLNQLKRKSAIIFVSHSQQAMKMFCERGIVLDHGEVKYDGEIDGAFMEYRAHNRNTSSMAGEELDEIVRSGFFGEEYSSSDITRCLVEIKNGAGEVSSTLSCGELATIDFEFYGVPNGAKVHLGLPIWDLEGNLIAAVNSNSQNKYYECINNRVAGNVSFRVPFIQGPLVIGIAVHEGQRYLIRKILFLISILSENPRDFGMIKIESKWGNKL